MWLSVPCPLLVKAPSSGAVARLWDICTLRVPPIKRPCTPHAPTAHTRNTTPHTHRRRCVCAHVSHTSNLWVVCACGVVAYSLRCVSPTPPTGYIHTSHSLLARWVSPRGGGTRVSVHRRLHSKGVVGSCVHACVCSVGIESRTREARGGPTPVEEWNRDHKDGPRRQVGESEAQWRHHCRFLRLAARC